MTKVARRTKPPATPPTEAPAAVEDKTPPAAGTAKAADVRRISKHFVNFRKQKNLAAAATTEAERLRDKELMPALVEYGTAHGEKGVHLAIDLPEPVDGFVRIVRRSNTSTFVDVDAAEKMLKRKGVLQEAQMTTVVITVPATDSEELLTSLEKLKLEKKFGTLPQVETSFSQEAMYALHQRHRAEIEERTKAGEKIGVRALSKYLLEDDIDGLLKSETRYSFNPET